MTKTNDLQFQIIMFDLEPLSSFMLVNLQQKARELANGTTVAVLNDEFGLSRRRSSVNSLSDPRLQCVDVVEQYSYESSTDPPEAMLNRSRSFSSRF